MSESTSLVIRFARLEDAGEISALHRSYVSSWYRLFENERFDVGYESLSIDERWGFGGPWMSIETCAIHLNNLLLYRALPYVAEIDGELVAEMELFTGREGQQYEKNMHIGLLYVRPEYRGRRIGEKLVAHACHKAKEHGCNTLTVAAKPEIEPFYRKCGFSTGSTLILIEALTRNFDAGVRKIPPPLSLQAFTQGLTMPAGRLQSSAYHVFELSDRFALPATANLEKRLTYVTISGAPAVIAWTVPSAGSANVSIWSNCNSVNVIIEAALQILHASGVSTANMLLAKKDYDHLTDDIEYLVKGSLSTLVLRL